MSKWPIALALALVPPLFAETPPPPPPVALHHATGSIVIDGDLSDAGWKDAATLDRFYETSPGDNVPARVRTIVYLTYDDRALYIGVRAEDPQPEKIRAPYVDRDGVLGTDDNIAVFLDTRNDRRSAVELRVNPRGIQGDAIFNDANGNEDFSPDFFYDTAARIDASGWTAEYRVPFSSLRYPKGDPQTWGILVWRNYPREYRYAFHSAPLPRGSNCLICFVEPVTGLAGLPAAGHLVAAPYVTSQRFAEPEGDPGTPLRDQPVHTDAGLDLKWNPTADHTVDLTLNPDFSQVEADAPQITVNRRFAVFFPEKRPFFLEGFDLFDTPLQVAYTRTITAPRWGVRSTGKIGAAAYTVLIADDRGGGQDVLPGSLFSDFAPQDFRSLSTIARVRRDLGTSFVGAILTDRESRGGCHNRLFGPDFQWRPNDRDSLTAQFLVSDTRNPDRPDLSSSWNGERLRSHAFTARYARFTQHSDFSVSASDVGEGFRANLGFIPQVGYRELSSGLGYTFYPEGTVRLVRPSIVVDRQTDRDNETIYDLVSVGVNLNGVKNLTGGALLRDERILVGGELLDQKYLDAVVQLDPSRRFSRVGSELRVGQSIDFTNARVGHGAYARVYATLRPIDRLTFDLDTSREWLNVSAGRVYTAQIESVRTTYSFSAKSLVRVIGQYVSNERDPLLYRIPVDRHSGDFLGSLLYSYKLNWQTVLFVGYGDDRTITPSNDLVRTDRSLFLKISYAIQR